MTATPRASVLGAALALLGLPVALAVVQAVSWHTHNRSDGVLVSSGQRREYVLHVPPGVGGARPVPLVISLHGAGLWGAAQRDISQWNRVADSAGLIVVYPSGLGGNGLRVWHAFLGEDASVDVRFIADLIDTLRASYNIDPARIYANGLSNGGGMSFVLSCTLSDRIAAIGTVGAAQLLPWRWCTDRRPVPMINFHGTADRAAPYEGGVSWVAPTGFANVQAWTRQWARRNGCVLNPVDSTVAADVVRRAYTGCAGDADVVLYTILGGGHTWPGGGPAPEWFVGTTTRSIDASSLMWAFFRDHPLRSH